MRPLVSTPLLRLARPVPACRLPARRSRFRALLLVASAIATISACAPSGPPRGLVLVVVDTLRADHLGAYGYARPTSPRIDALAEDGVLFLDAVSPAPWTLPSLATLMTSLAPAVHGARSPSDVEEDLKWYFDPDSFRPFSSLHPSRTTLAEVLKGAGFATFGAVQGSYPTEVFGMGQGFEVYRQNQTPGIRFDVEDALAWLDAERPERFLVYLHVIEVHAPYQAPQIHRGQRYVLDPERMPAFERAVAEERRRYLEKDFDPHYRGPVDGSIESLRRLRQVGRVGQRDLRHLVALYDRGIAYVDHWVGQLVDGLRDRGLLDETLLVLTSDHGEEFLEHGGLEHSYSYYEEMLRVPLVFRVPDEGRGAVVERTVGLVDVMPTVLDVLGVSGPADMQGRSLRGLWRDDEDWDGEYVGDASFRRGTHALRGSDFKYIRARSEGGAPREELYDLATDRAERRNLCESDPAACAPYRERLADRLERQRERASALPAPEAAPIDSGTREALEALGYLDDPAATE